MPRHTFEIGVYNAKVRDAVEAGRHHTDLRDEWADIHYLEIEADDEAEVRMTAARRFPAEAGYILDSVTQLVEFE